jgi:hypothetical protein
VLAVENPIRRGGNAVAKEEDGGEYVGRVAVHQWLQPRRRVQCRRARRSILCGQSRFPGPFGHAFASHSSEKCHSLRSFRAHKVQQLDVSWLSHLATTRASERHPRSLVIHRR